MDWPIRSNSRCRLAEFSRTLLTVVLVLIGTLELDTCARGHVSINVHTQVYVFFCLDFVLYLWLISILYERKSTVYARLLHIHPMYIYCCYGVPDVFSLSTHSKVYGNTSRRQAIARLRENSADRGPASPPVVEPQRCCALGDIMVNQAVEIHEKHKQGTLQASRPKIASDSHNVSLIKLDVEKVSDFYKSRVPE